MPYTAKEETANNIKIPMLVSIKMTSSAKGIKAQETKLKENEIKGANTKTNIFDVDG